MARVTVTEAARLAGRSRSRLYAGYIRPGKIAVETDEEGRRFIDTSELLRVFGSLRAGDSGDSLAGVAEDATTHPSSVTGDGAQSKTAQLQDTLKALLEEKSSRVALLGNELEQSRQREAWMKEQLEQAQQREQWLKEQLDNATKLLEHKEQGAEQKKGFWARLLGK